jgi:hypothetical protein
MPRLLVKYPDNRIRNNQVTFAVPTVVAAVSAADLDLDVRVRTLWWQACRLRAWRDLQPARLPLQVTLRTWNALSFRAP